MTNPHLRRRRPIGAPACGGGRSSAPPIATIAPRNVTVSVAPGSWGTHAGLQQAADAGDREAGSARG